MEKVNTIKKERKIKKIWIVLIVFFSVAVVGVGTFCGIYFGLASGYCNNNLKMSEDNAKFYASDFLENTKLSVFKNIKKSSKYSSTRRKINTVNPLNESYYFYEINYKFTSNKGESTLVISLNGNE